MSVSQWNEAYGFHAALRERNVPVALGGVSARGAWRPGREQMQDMEEHI